MATVPSTAVTIPSCTGLKTGVSPLEAAAFKVSEAPVDEDEVPSGVDVLIISKAEENLLNSKRKVYEVTLVEKWTYAFYCAPHQGAVMAGKGLK